MRVQLGQLAEDWIARATEHDRDLVFEVLFTLTESSWRDRYASQQDMDDDRVTHIATTDSAGGELWVSWRGLPFPWNPDEIVQVIFLGHPDDF